MGTIDICIRDRLHDIAVKAVIEAVHGAIKTLQGIVGLGLGFGGGAARQSDETQHDTHHQIDKTLGTISWIFAKHSALFS